MAPQSEAPIISELQHCSKPYVTFIPLRVPGSLYGKRYIIRLASERYFHTRIRVWLFNEPLKNGSTA